jgi:putative FmdB family regulatory protein
MPLYEFSCACGREQEILMKMDDPLPYCPTCRTPMDRKVSRSSFALRGDGWAKDNYGIRRPSSKSRKS